MSQLTLGYVSFQENLRVNVKKEGKEVKIEGKKKMKKNKIELNTIYYFYLLLNTDFIYSFKG